MAFLLIAGALWIYLPALRGEFIWDDDTHFTGNSAVTRWRGLIDIWTTRSAVYYPLVLTTAWAVHKAVGFDPLVFHTLTWALHVGAALLLVATLRRFRVPGAWLAGFLFAWHPLQVESVAWVTELKNTQSLFLLLLSVLALERSGFFASPRLPDRAARRWMMGSVALFALALLSKPSVVMVPPVLVLLVWYRRGIRRWVDIDALFPFFLLALLAAGWTVWEQRYSSGAQGFEWDHGPFARLALAGQVFWHYLEKAVWPHPLMFLYPAQDPTGGGWRSWGPGLAAAGLFAALWRVRWAGARPACIALIAYAILLFPVMGFFNVYFMRYAWVADHFAYLPLIPLCIAAGVGWAGWERRTARTARLVAALVLLVLAGLSHRHAATFRDPETLWQSAIAANPGAWMAHNNLGLLRRGEGDRDAARRHFSEALRHNPRHYEALNNLGAEDLEDGRTAEALARFDEALALRPELYRAWLNRGQALAALGDVDTAMDAYREAGRRNPAIEAPLVLTATLAERTGRPDEAVAAYRALLAGKGLTGPELGKFLYERAFRLHAEGADAMAEALLSHAGEQAPEIADIPLLRGEVLERLGRLDAAVKSYRLALALRPGWGAGMTRLARLLAAHPDPSQRNPDEALALTGAMLAAGAAEVPEVLDIHAMALAAAGRTAEAERTAAQAAALAGDDPAARDAYAARRALYRDGLPYTIPEPVTP